MGEEGAYAHFCATVDAASAVGVTDPAVLERIKRPERVHEVTIPLVRDDGQRWRCRS